MDSVLERKKENMKKLANAYTNAKSSGKIIHITSVRFGKLAERTNAGGC